MTTDEADVAALSDAYEAALLRNDVQALNDAFWDSPDVIRFGVAEQQRGIAAIRSWRHGAPPVSVERRALWRDVRQLAPGVVAVDLVFRDGDAPVVGRQSQTWVRAGDVWRIARAHVSVVPG